MTGESMEFMDHREYQPGDDLRRLDWAAYARSDKMIVKLYPPGGVSAFGHRARRFAFRWR